MDKLSDYLKAELRARDWTQTDLARRVGTSRQMVWQWLSEDEFTRATPSPESCRKLAAALNEDPDTILVLAGHREPSPFSKEEEDPAIRQLMQLARSLPKEELAEVVDFAEYRKQRRLISSIRPNANRFSQELMVAGASR